MKLLVYWSWYALLLAPLSCLSLRTPSFAAHGRRGGGLGAAAELAGVVPPRLPLAALPRVPGPRPLQLLHHVILILGCERQQPDFIKLGTTCEMGLALNARIFGSSRNSGFVRLG